MDVIRPNRGVSSWNIRFICNVYKEGDFTKLSGQDFGIGIKKEDQERVFDRFERAVSVLSYGGFGLGLYISQQIARAHGGNILVKSQLGVGSTFILEIPV